MSTIVELHTSIIFGIIQDRPSTKKSLIFGLYRIYRFLLSWTINSELTYLYIEWFKEEEKRKIFTERDMWPHINRYLFFSLDFSEKAEKHNYCFSKQPTTQPWFGGALKAACSSTTTRWSQYILTLYNVI